MDFKPYKKFVPTQARVLTEQDYTLRQGTIPTLEGPQPFTPGDYLARNAKGEWPIKQATMQEHYTQVAPQDKDGFAFYEPSTPRLAAQMPESFTIRGLQGKAGDYLVLDEGSGWPVDCELFEQTYRIVE